MKTLPPTARHLQPANAALRFVLLDAIPIFRAGLRSALRNQPNWEVMGEGGSSRELESLLVVHQPDVVLLDARLPAQLGARRTPDNTFHLLANLPLWRRRFPTTRFLLLVENSSRSLLDFVAQAGASGCIDRAEVSVETITAALRCVVQQAVYFSPAPQTVLYNMPYTTPMPLSLRQLAVLATLAYHPAQSYAEQARTLSITEPTLRKHLGLIYQRLGVPNLTAAVLVAMHRGWFTPDPGVVVGVPNPDSGHQSSPEALCPTAC